MMRLVRILRLRSYWANQSRRFIENYGDDVLICINPDYGPSCRLSVQAIRHFSFLRYLSGTTHSSPDAMRSLQIDALYQYSPPCVGRSAGANIPAVKQTTESSVTDPVY
jgi:hypothetical protein